MSKSLPNPKLKEGLNEWVKRAEQHVEPNLEQKKSASELGRERYGSGRYGRPTLTIEEVRQIKELRGRSPSKWSLGKLAKTYNVSMSTIHRAIHDIGYYANPAPLQVIKNRKRRSDVGGTHAKPQAPSTTPKPEKATPAPSQPELPFVEERSKEERSNESGSGLQALRKAYARELQALRQVYAKAIERIDTLVADNAALHNKLNEQEARLQRLVKEQPFELTFTEMTDAVNFQRDALAASYPGDGIQAHIIKTKSADLRGKKDTVYVVRISQYHAR